MGQSARDFLKAEIDRKLEVASNITEAAQKAARSLTADEKQQVESLLAEVNQFKARVQEMDDNERITKSIEEMKRPVNQEAKAAPRAAKSFGEAFVQSDAFRTLHQAFKSGNLTGNWTSGPVDMPNFFQKATVDSTAAPIVQPDFQAGILPGLSRPLTIADLIAQGQTDSSVVRYIEETSATNAAATVAEGDEKPESAFTFDAVDEPVRKIATFLPLTDEMLEDAAQLRTYLDGRLRQFVQLEEEDQILAGDGAGTNIRGLLNRTGIQTTAVAAPGAGVTNTDSIAALLYTAITNIRVNALVEPDGIVMHPTNYAALRLAQDNNNQFNAGGPFGPQAGNQVWGLPVAVSAALPLNTALVGAFRTQAQVFRRNGLTVEASNSHADFFRRNMTAIRAEERLALAVYRPAAFHTITGLQNVGATG